MTTELSQEDRDRIRALYNDVIVFEEGPPRVIARRWSIGRISREFQISRETVEKILTTTGPYTSPSAPPTGRAARARTPQTEQEQRMHTVDWESVRVARRAGKSYAAIARELRTTGRTVKNHLLRLEREDH